jgi:hypothetical protein
MLARLSPHAFALASPQAVRDAICRHFAPIFARAAIEGLASRHPDKSAKARAPFWQSVTFAFLLAATLGAVTLAPLNSIWVGSLALALLFVPLIAFQSLWRARFPLTEGLHD